MFASSSVYFFGEIMITLKNVFSIIYLIVLIPFAGSTFIIITILFVKRISSCFFFFLSFRVQSILWISYFIGYINPSLFLNIIGRMFLTRFSSGRVISLTLNFFYLKSSITFVFLRLAFINSIFIKMFFYISVITRASLLITLYIIFRSVSWLFYQIFASYNIIECTAATWIFRVSFRASPYFPITPYILAAAFSIFSIF